jgi:hypothetical protein
MVREYRDVERVVKERQLVQTTCDLCGRVAAEGNWCGESRWPRIDDETQLAVRVCRKRMETYGSDSGDTEELSYDICPQCFTDKLVPWLQGQGAQAKPVNFSW